VALPPTILHPALPPFPSKYHSPRAHLNSFLENAIRQTGCSPPRQSGHLCAPSLPRVRERPSLDLSLSANHAVIRISISFPRLALSPAILALSLRSLHPRHRLCRRHHPRPRLRCRPRHWKLGRAPATNPNPISSAQGVHRAVDVATENWAWAPICAAARCQHPMPRAAASPPPQEHPQPVTPQEHLSRSVVYS
jgi:hypothetical protein